jgi:cyclin B
MLIDECETDKHFSFDNYTAIQIDINEKMRAVLIDWLVDVHKLFDLNPETIFLAVDIIDKYLCRKFILKHRLQLLGITSLWIACKYLDIFTIDLKYCVYVTDNTYTESEIKKMEFEIFSSLNFTITAPSLFKFYDILAVNFCLGEKTYYTGRYLLETFLLDTGINRYKKSLIACSAVYLAMKINGEDISYYNLVKCYTDEDEKLLKECAKQILFLIMNMSSLGFNGIINKYATEEYLGVSKIQIYN